MDIKLSKLQVTNFRNLANTVLDFSSGINCIFGNNGNGKTNILEAIHYLVNRKSFRKNTSFPQVISIDGEKPEILFSSLFKNEDSQFTYTGKWLFDSNQWFRDNSPTKSKVGVETVFINPFDSYSFHTIPAFRRDWIDSHLSKINKQYKSTLKKFEQSLRFRNKLLAKKPPTYIDQIKAIHPQLSEYSFFLLQERKHFVAALSDYCGETFKIIFDEVHELKLEIESKFLNYSQEMIKNFYDESIQKDDVLCKTQYGIHRDDYVFNFDGFNSFEYCSLGQQKMSYLSLIFAYIELFRYKFNSYPLVLIDDVSGELDSRRWENLIEYLEAKRFQVFITTANENFRKKLEKIKDSKKFYMSNGNVEQT